MKTLISLLLLFPLLASAKSFTLIDDVTKETFVCNSVAATSATTAAPPAGSNDSDCVAKITTLCRERGAVSEKACSDLATRRCKGKSENYTDCARSHTQACIDSSSGSAPTCLDRSLRECK